MYDGYTTNTPHHDTPRSAKCGVDVVTFSGIRSGAIARVALPLDGVDTAVWRIQRALVVAAVVAAALAAAVAAVVAAKITGPLTDLRRQARAVAAGRLDVAVVPAGVHELGEVGRAFNAMTAKLRALIAESEQARARLEAMLANLSDGVVITDASGAIVRLNDAAARMLGTTGDEAVGRSFVVVSRDHDLADLLRRSLDDGSPRAATVEHRPGRLVLEAAARPLVGGTERLGLVVLRDVSELRRLERVRREFVANVSHELRTPLASIKALAETLGDGARADPAVAADFLRQIVDEVDRLAAMVEDLLDLGRLEAGRVPLKLEPLDAVDLVRRGVERLRPQTERAGLALRVEVEAGLPPVRADRARVEQVLVNLVHNAIKFTPAGGAVVVAAAAAGTMLEVAVRDTGVGIAAEELPRLFERFYKADKARHSPGTGLGLAIAKHIVQAHGGTIRAESVPGRGAIFVFTLPLAEIPRSRRLAARVGSDRRQPIPFS